MKTCPSCGYGNPDAGLKCGICAQDIAGVPAKAAAIPENNLNSSNLMVLAGLLLLLCGALFYFMQNSPWKQETLTESGEDAVTDENSFSYEGVLYSLDKMKELRFLPEADRRRALPLFSSSDDRVAIAAVKAAGAWARAEKEEALGRLWFETLLETASSGRPAVRRQAALEAGFAAALGFPVSPYVERVRRAAAGLVAQKEEGLREAGFLLSAMAGLEDFTGEMRETLSSDPSSSARLYAACALSRLGLGEGHRYLSRVVSGADSAIRNEALTCLSYSASPEAERLLLSASKDAFDGAAAEAAKRGLLLRKQLAIIKK